MLSHPIAARAWVWRGQSDQWRGTGCGWPGISGHRGGREGNELTEIWRDRRGQRRAEMTPTGSSRSGAVGGNVSVESFSFGIPLADVSKFVIGTRPIRTHEWRNVELRAPQPK